MSTQDAFLDRRQLLLGAGALALSACRLPLDPRPRPAASGRIQRIQVYPVRYPLTGYFKFFSGPQGSRGRAAVLVKITADDGTVGWGQSVPIAKWSYETLETATLCLRRYYAPALLGHDAADIEGAHAKMDQAIAPGFSTGMPITRAGIDLALHDLAGKLVGRSLREMWGLKKQGPKTLTLSWTVNVLSLDEVEKLVQEGHDRGYEHFNIKVAPDPQFDLQLARRVRELAPKGFLWADANGGYDPSAALVAAPKLADAGVDVLEAPLKPNRISGYQALKKQGALPIYMDEGIVSPVELEEFIRLQMLDGVAMKPARCGGLLSARRQIQRLLDSGLSWLGSGLTDPDISLAACLGLYAAYGLEKPAALNGPQFLTADILDPPHKVERGQLAVPEGPGLGITVDKEKLQALLRGQTR